MLLFEAAGFDVIIVETVGVGQSETMVAGMVDLFVLLQLVNAGDDLQTIKKGIIEIADLVLFNKADIDEKATEMARLQMKTALTMLRPASRNWQVPVLAVSALAKRGIQAFWAEVERYRDTMTISGEFDAKRRRQSLAWMWTMIDSGVRQHFRQHPAVAAELAQLTQAVAEGRMTPGAAAHRLLDSI
jgi:LAO/AO transport system kinase